MIKFVMLVTIWTADSPPSVYVMGSALTGAECIEMVVDYEGEHSASCEIDQAGEYD